MDEPGNVGSLPLLQTGHYSDIQMWGAPRRTAAPLLGSLRTAIASCSEVCPTYATIKAEPLLAANPAVRHAKRVPQAATDKLLKPTACAKPACIYQRAGG